MRYETSNLRIFTGNEAEINREIPSGLLSFSSWRRCQRNPFVCILSSFPDLSLSWLVFVALVPFLTGISSMDRGQAFSSGIIMGLAHYTTLLYWLVPTLCSFGGLWFPASVCTLLLLCLYLSLYPALFALAWKTLHPGPVAGPLAGACLWTLLEICRTWLFTGFPWGVLGYSQYKQTIIVQTADLFGVIGISFVIVWINIFLAQILSYRQKGSIFTSAIATLALCAGVWSYGSYQIDRMDEVLKKAQKIRVSVIQGNIGEDEKRNSSMISHAVDTYEQLSLQAAKKRPALIIWPETALPFLYKQEKWYSPGIDACIQKAETSFLVGALNMAPPKDNNSSPRLRNRAIMINADGLSTGYYDKHHLVPFGEYVPLAPLLGRLGKLIAQAGNFSPGPGNFSPLVFQAPKASPSDDKSASGPASYSAGVLICFESLFPDLSRQFVLHKADMLAVITNDAWFGNTSAPAQHFSLAILRAVENRRSVARAANTGISGFIDPAGRILEQSQMDEKTFLITDIPVLPKLTIYTRYPFILPLGALLALLAIYVLHTRKNNILFQEDFP